MEAYRDEMFTLLLKSNVSRFLETTYHTSYDEEGVLLSKVVNIVRRDMLSMSYPQFNGTFGHDCQQNAVRDSLLTLVRMITDGPIKTQSDMTGTTQSALSLAQLLLYNSTTRRREGSSTAFHSTKREPPLPIYIGLLLHAETRKRGLIDRLQELGVSISYNRVLALSTEIGNSVCMQFDRDQLVCPPKLRKGVFTTSAVDNIAHNPSSTTANGSFHGTGISLFQHLTMDNQGHKRDVITFDTNEDSKTRSIPSLPDA